MVSTSEFRNGMIIKYENGLWEILEYQLVKMQQGLADPVCEREDNDPGGRIAGPGSGDRNRYIRADKHRSQRRDRAVRKRNQNSDKQPERNPAWNRTPIEPPKIRPQDAVRERPDKAVALKHLARWGAGL